jgi:methylaspartate mutase epsilon subunit
MKIQVKPLEKETFSSQREEVISSWPTGKAVNFKDAVAYHHSMAEDKRFSAVLKKANKTGQVLIQPRAGVALVEEHIALLRYLEDSCDLLPTTIDAYTRQNRYEEAAKGIEKSIQARHSLLNGFPAVNHGLEQCRSVVESVSKPIQIRHGTPDARLLAEISLAAGFSAFEGGGISYNIPYTKKVPLERSILHWQYVDHLVGMYEKEGIRIDREPFGPLSGTLVPPFVSHCVAIIEGLLALGEGARSLTLGYGQAGNLNQDIAALVSLRELAGEYFREAGFDSWELSTVFHQWMGGFPESEAKAFGVISWGGTIAALGRATKVIVKTPHEAMGIPTKEANKAGLEATRQIINMLGEQPPLMTARIREEADIIKREVRAVLTKVFELGDGDPAAGAVRAFQAGVLDVPFAPSTCNLGRMVPVRDNEGAVRLFEPGNIPLDNDLVDFHRKKLKERSITEGREAGFQMVIDDIYAISKGKLVGRPS